MESDEVGKEIHGCNMYDNV